MVLFSRSSGRRLCGLISASLVLGALVAAVLFALPWLGVIITPMILRKATLAFLIGLEITYVAALVVLVAGTIVFSAVLWRACRREREGNAFAGGLLGRTLAERKATMGHAAARGLLLCVSSLLAIGVAELVVGLRGSGAELADGDSYAEAELTERVAGAWRERGVTADGARSVLATTETSRERGDTADGTRRVPATTETLREAGVTLAVLGESSAFGIPFDRWFSVGKIVAWQLEGAMPSRKFQVEMLAEPGATLERQFRKLGGLKRRPDALIVYCGHNEFAATIPWSRKLDYYIDEKPSLLQRLDELAARASPVCGLICQTADRFRVGLVPPNALRPPLVDAPAYTAAEYAARLADFRRRLDAIASYGQRIGAVTILVVPPSNDARFDPNRSFLPAETTRAGREAFAREFMAARGLEATHPARAISLYRSLLERQPGFAETHYRLAGLLENAGAWDEAYEHFVKARDCDGLPMRCMTPFQEAYRDVAARHDCALVDGQGLFHSVGPHGLLDDHLFMDAMHPSLWGQAVIAQGILDMLKARSAFGWPNPVPAPRIGIAECATHFGLHAKDWRLIAERGCMFAWGTALLRHDRSAREARMAAFRRAVQRLASGEAPEAIGMPNLGVPAGAVSLDNSN
jgi:hypothetical protein